MTVLQSKSELNLGLEMHNWAKDLWPFNRSITGAGVRETLRYLQNILPDLTIQEVPTGYRAFDWEVPKEWSVEEAYIESPEGERIVDFNSNNLHLVGYSTPVNAIMSLAELQSHLYSEENQPEVIPYITSYYKERWGFCLTQKQRNSLEPGDYRVIIKSKLKQGVLNYGELLIQGESEKEIFLSTYICHPSMANNELSGPVVATMLAREIQKKLNQKYSYRIVFVPETIGSIVYVSKNLDVLKKNIIAGYNLSCMGDERCYSYLPSRNGQTVSDKAALHVLKHIDPNFKNYTWLDRGSDEKQYCMPGIDLPVATIMRSKYGTFPEYHTSADDLNFVTPKGLNGSFEALMKAINVIEANEFYQAKVLGEPQLGKRGLYPSVSKKNQYAEVRLIVDVFSYCDGEHSVLDIAEILDTPFQVVYSLIQKLLLNELVGLILKNK